MSTVHWQDVYQGHLERSVNLTRFLLKSQEMAHHKPLSEPNASALINIAGELFSTLVRAANAARACRARLRSCPKLAPIAEEEDGEMVV